MSKLFKYMVVFEIPELTLEMHEVIPRQQMVVEVLFQHGVLINYTLSSEKDKLWALMQADSESELINHIESLPITEFCDYDYDEILFHDAARFTPKMSLN